MTDTDPENDGQAQAGEPFVVIKGLWLVEFHELHESLPPGAIRKQSRAADDGRTYGDLGTIVAVLTLTSAALQTFTAWLQARQAKHLGRTEPQPEPSGQGYTLELRSDGTVVITLPPLGGTDGERSGDPALSIQELRVQLERLLGP
ncbi:hypothetical protein AB5J55_42020 [Streptomyces sp. R11]|uniref:Uncharacterized protein n=1 Tax=Streptomyces sp. R11 TaxID=3238625 RepID=A0AB39NE61_9ACTN